jgi:hypothetical protein
MHIVIRIPEWSTLSPYHREIFLTAFSKIITDNNLYYKISKEKVLNIENCDMSCYIAIQPLKFARMLGENENWESLASDRFVKFILINPIRKNITEKKPENKFYEIFTCHDLREIEVNDETIKPIIKLFETQFTTARAKIHARHYTQALAALLGKKRVDSEIVKTFLQLFSPYLMLYDKFLIRYSLDEPVKLQVASINLFSQIAQHNSIGQPELAKKMHCTEREIRRVTALLNDVGLIRKTINEKRQVEYSVSSWIKSFFTWYKNQTLEE